MVPWWTLCTFSSEAANVSALSLSFSVWVPSLLMRGVFLVPLDFAPVSRKNEFQNSVPSLAPSSLSICSCQALSLSVLIDSLTWQGHCLNVGPLSSTLSQRWNSVGQVLASLRVYCHLAWCFQAGDSQLVPMSTRPMSTRTHGNSCPCQLVPPINVNSYHKGCQLLPQVMSTRTQQSRYHIMVHTTHTTDVNSYPCQLVPLIDVNSYHH